MPPVVPVGHVELLELLELVDSNAVPMGVAPDEVLDEKLDIDLNDDPVEVSGVTLEVSHIPNNVSAHDVHPGDGAVIDEIFGNTSVPGIRYESLPDPANSTIRASTAAMRLLEDAICLDFWGYEIDEEGNAVDGIDDLKFIDFGGLAFDPDEVYPELKNDIPSVVVPDSNGVRRRYRVMSVWAEGGIRPFRDGDGVHRYISVLQLAVDFVYVRL